MAMPEPPSSPGFKEWCATFEGQESGSDTDGSNSGGNMRDYRELEAMVAAGHDNESGGEEATDLHANEFESSFAAMEMNGVATSTKSTEVQRGFFGGVLNERQVARIRYRRAAKAARETQAKLDRAHRLAAKEQAKEAAKERKAAALALKANGTMPPSQRDNGVGLSNSDGTETPLALAVRDSSGNEVKEVAAPLRSPIWDTFETPIQSPVPSPPHSPRHRKGNGAGLGSNGNGSVGAPPPQSDLIPLLTVGASVQVRDGFSGEWQSGFVHGVCRTSGRPKVKVLGHKKAFEWDEWRLDHGAQPISSDERMQQQDTHHTLPGRQHSVELEEGDEEGGVLRPPLPVGSPPLSGEASSGGSSNPRRAQRGWLGGLLSEEQLERRAESRRRAIDRRASQLERREYRLAEKRHGQNQRAAAFAEAHGRPPKSSSEEARAGAAAKAVEEFKRREEERETHRSTWAEARADAEERRRKMQQEHQGPRRANDRKAVKEVAFFEAHRRWPSDDREMSAWLNAKAQAEKDNLAQDWRELREKEALTKADFREKRRNLAKEKMAVKQAHASRWHSFERLAQAFEASQGRPAEGPQEVGAWAALEAAEERKRIESSEGQAQEEQKMILAEIRDRKRRLAEEKGLSSRGKTGAERRAEEEEQVAVALFTRHHGYPPLNPQEASEWAANRAVEAKNKRRAERAAQKDAWTELRAEAKRKRAAQRAQKQAQRDAIARGSDILNGANTTRDAQEAKHDAAAAEEHEVDNDRSSSSSLEVDQEEDMKGESRLEFMDTQEEENEAEETDNGNTSGDSWGGEEEELNEASLAEERHAREVWEEVIALVGVPHSRSSSLSSTDPITPSSAAAQNSELHSSPPPPVAAAGSTAAPTTTTSCSTKSSSSSISSCIGVDKSSNGSGGGRRGDDVHASEAIKVNLLNNASAADAATAVSSSSVDAASDNKESDGAAIEASSPSSPHSPSSSPVPTFGGTPRAAALLLRYRQRLLELNSNLASDAAASNMVLDTSTLGRYLVMANGHISPLVGVKEEDEEAGAGEGISNVSPQKRGNSVKKPPSSSSALRSPSPSERKRGRSISQSRNGAATAPSQAETSSSNGVRCAATLLVETVRWRKEQRMGQLPKEVLLQAARARQLHVSGYDRDGRAVVLYTPTTESACPVDLSVLWTVFNLDLAIQRSQEGAGPNGTCIAEYTFVIDFAKTSTGSPPLKTVRAVISVLGQHYPGRTGHIVLVHGGAMMTWIVRALKPLTPKHMRDKMLIVSKSDEAAGKMLKLIEPSQLEQRFIGGELNFNFDPDAYLSDYTPLLEPDLDLTRKNAAFLDTSKGDYDAQWGIRI